MPNLDFVHRVGSRLARIIFALAAIDAVMLYLLRGSAFFEAFRDSKTAIQFGIAQLVIMAAGFMFLLHRKTYGAGLLLVAVYIFARDAVQQTLFSR